MKNLRISPRNQLTWAILALCLHLNIQAQNPDAIYPLPSNYGTEVIEDVNLFNGTLNKELSLYKLDGGMVDYELQALYNSASANAINQDTSKYVSNILGGYGWKMMDYPKIVQDASGYHLVDGRASYPLQTLTTGSYTVGGGKYLWRINIDNNKWRVSDGDGNHYNFSDAAVTIDGVSVWNFTSKVNYMSTDSLTLSYTGQGNIYQMWNNFGDTITLSYTTSDTGKSPLLTSLDHSKNGQQIAQILYKYQTYNLNGGNYSLFSEIIHNHQISGVHFSQKNASTKFNYLKTGESPPLGGDSYIGAMSTETTPNGAIYTYTYESKAISGKTNYRVVQYAVNDGYNNNSGNIFDPHTYHGISYDDSNVLISSDYVYSYYNKVMVAPGGRYNASIDSIKNPYGNIEYYFLNGQSLSKLDDLPSNYPNTSITSSILKGHLYQKNVNSDSTISNSLTEKVNILNYWDLGYLKTGKVGAFPKLIKTYDEKHGIGKWMTYTYGTIYQLPVTISTSRRNPNPLTSTFNKDSLIQKITYAFEDYSALASNKIYLINKSSKVVNLVQEDMQGAFSIVDCNCTQWTQWGSNGLAGSTGYWNFERKVRMRSATADTSACITATTTSSDWLVMETVNSRTPLGNISSNVTLKNGSTSNLFSTSNSGEIPVATFREANIYTTSTSKTANADYLGFETYERNFESTWTVISKKINTDYAHTGDQSFSGSMTRKFTSSGNGGRFYIITAWVGMRKNGDSYTIKLSNSSGSVVASSSESWKAGDPTLAFVEISGFIANGKDFTASLETKGSAFVDDVVVMPANATFQGNVYAIERGIKEAELGMNGATAHIVHNRFNSQIAQVGPGSIQNINNLQIPYNSRRGNRFFNDKDTFDTKYPNMTLHASSRSGGNWQGFQYQTNGSFPPQNLSGMTIEDDWLVATSSSASATFSHTVDTANMTFYTEVFPDNLIAAEEIGFSLLLDSLSTSGSVLSTKELKLVMTGNSIKLYSGNVIYKTVPISNVLNSTSILININNYNDFHAYINGRYVFEYEFDSRKIHGPIKLITNNKGAAFDNFIYAASPTIYQETYDALQRPRQHLTQHDLDEIKVHEILYGGPLNLPMAESRPAILGGDDNNGLSYKPNFTKGFDYNNMTLSDSSILGGASYYDNPFNTSVEYNNSPLLSLQSMGGGGQFTAGEADGHYNKFTYRENAGNIFDYTTDELLVTTKTEPNGTKKYTYTNREEVIFGIAQVQGGDTLRTQHAYNNQFLLAKTYHPNFYNKQLADFEKYIIEYQYDFIGNQISVKTPDAGTTQYVYDPAGQLRFSMDSAGHASATNQIIYYKYDRLSRIIEEGILNLTWDRNTLQSMADTQPTYPTSGNYTPRKSFTYDGKGLEFKQGKLISAQVNWDQDGIFEVSETFEYDEYGNMTKKSLSASDFGSPQIVQYEYDLENRVVLTKYPNTSHPGITYSYGGNNQIVSVGIPGDDDYYAAYEYDHNTIEYLNNRNLIRTYAYNKAGWPIEINDQILNETLSYEHTQGTAQLYNYNGKIAGLHNKMKWSGDSIIASFNYDPDDRLKQANYGASNAWNLGQTTPLTYDNNGNILTMQRGSNPSINYSYNSGSNKINATGSSENFSYNGNGSVTSLQNGVGSITYDPVSQLTLSGAYKGVSASYQYNGNNQRVLKSVTYASSKTSKRLYVHGMNDYPLIEVHQDSTGNTTTSFYIYGPKGLIAIEQGNERLFVLKDHIGSVRAVVDTTNTVKAYFNYSAFGNLMSSSIDPSIAHFSLNYRFTGQEVELELGGIYNYRARLYDPLIGRFFSPDPKMQYPSPYEYAGNNPINYIDPTGQWGFWSTLATAAVSVAATAAIIVSAPVTLPSLGVAALAVAGGTLAGVVAGGAAGLITGDGFKTGALYGLGIGFTAAAATVGAVALAGGTGYSALARLAIRPGLFTGSNAVAVATGIRNFFPVVAAGSYIGTGIWGRNTPTDATDFPRTNITIKKIPSTVHINTGETTITVQNLNGYYATFNLKDATFQVPNSPEVYNCSSNSDNKDFCPGQPYNSRLMVLKDWNKQFSSRLKMNANFFSIYNISKPNLRDYPCTKILGPCISDHEVIAGPTVKDISGCLDEKEICQEGCGNLMDAFVVLENPSEVRVVPNANLQALINTNRVKHAVGGGQIIKDGKPLRTSEMSKSLKANGTMARTAIGISQDGKSIVFITIQSGFHTSGMTGRQLALYLKYNLNCYNAINLDNSGSSQFIFNEDNKIKYITIKGDLEGYRPIPNFIGVK